jgi:uncharacterized protein with PQ loop repeat
MYAIMLEDYYIFIANSPGVVCGTYCVVSSLVIMEAAKSKSGLQDINFRVLEIILLGGVTFFLILGMLIGITMSSWEKSAKDLVVALIANTACVMYYGAPCSSMYKVIVTKDSSSLFLPMIFVNFLNAILWSVYGYFALHDLFVVVPNSIGLFLSMLQLCLLAAYPSLSLQKNGYEHDDIGRSIKESFVSVDNGVVVEEVDFSLRLGDGECLLDTDSGPKYSTDNTNF